MAGVDPDSEPGERLARLVAERHGRVPRRVELWDDSHGLFGRLKLRFAGQVRATSARYTFTYCPDGENRECITHYVAAQYRNGATEESVGGFIRTMVRADLHEMVHWAEEGWTDDDGHADRWGDVLWGVMDHIGVHPGVQPDT